MTKTSTGPAPTIAPNSFLERIRHLVDRNFGTWRGLVRLVLAQLEYLLGWLDPYVRPVTDARRLVFVCLGNINRSAFADAVAADLGWSCCSIGLSTTSGQAATPQAQKTAARVGLDLSAHRARNFSDYEYQDGDVLFVMEIRHVGVLLERGIPANAIRLLGRWSSPLRLHLHDPHTLSDAYFLTCFTLIRSAVINLCRELPPTERSDG